MTHNLVAVLVVATGLLMSSTALADSFQGNSIQQRLFGLEGAQGSAFVVSSGIAQGFPISLEGPQSGGDYTHLELAGWSEHARQSGLLLSSSVMLAAGLSVKGANSEKADMLNLKKRSLVTGALFLPAVLTGFWLTQKGSPPPTWLVTGHKLFILADLVYLNKTFFEAKKLGLIGGTDVAAMGMMNLFFVGTIATGAMLTLEQEMPQAVTTAHHVTPWLTVASSALMLYLLGR